MRYVCTQAQGVACEAYSSWQAKKYVLIYSWMAELSMRTLSDPSVGCPAPVSGRVHDKCLTLIKIADGLAEHVQVREARGVVRVRLGIVLSSQIWREQENGRTDQVITTWLQVKLPYSYVALLTALIRMYLLLISLQHGFFMGKHGKVKVRVGNHWMGFDDTCICMGFDDTCIYIYIYMLHYLFPFTPFTFQPHSTGLFS